MRPVKSVVSVPTHANVDSNVERLEIRYTRTASTDEKRNYLSLNKFFKNIGPKKKSFHSYVQEDLVNFHLLASTAVSLELRRNVPRKYFQDKFKRSLDLIISVLGIIFFAPFLLIFGYLIKRETPGPVFYTQRRLGKNFVPFQIIKFRTMFVPKAGKDDTPEEITGRPAAKVNMDPRTTKIGSFLRKWKLDEMPQLFNVFLGDMTVVGPRPLSLEESICCPDRYVERFSVQPGMTGLWQARYDNSIDYLYKLRLDAIYARKWSFLGDVMLILATIPRVLKGEKAYRVKDLVKKRAKSALSKKAS